MSLLTIYLEPFVCSVDRVTRYNCVKKNQLDAQLILIILRQLYMFRAYLGPSSGGTTVCIQKLVLIFLFRRLSFVLVGLEQSNQDNSQSFKKNYKYKMLYT